MRRSDLGRGIIGAMAFGGLPGWRCPECEERLPLVFVVGLALKEPKIPSSTCCPHCGSRLHPRVPSFGLRFVLVLALGIPSIGLLRLVGGGWLRHLDDRLLGTLFGLYGGLLTYGVRLGLLRIPRRVRRRSSFGVGPEAGPSVSYRHSSSPSR